MTCSAVSLLVPLSMEKKAPKEECRLSFDTPPSYLALLDSIEQQPTALKLEDVKFYIMAGKESVRQDNWARVVGDTGAIKLEVSFVARLIPLTNLLMFATATCAVEVCTSLCQTL